jgi:hypothetical protein
MGKKISAGAALRLHGLELIECMDSVVPACCSDGCEVEPDGHCEHGHESVLLSIGLI